MSKILCIVNSPLQLLNCVEYLQSSRLAEVHKLYLLVLVGRPQGDFACKAALSRYQNVFSEISSLECEAVADKRGYSRLLLEVYRYRRRIDGWFMTCRYDFDHLVLGHSSGYDFAYFHRRVGARTTIVDDGGKTLHFLKNPQFRHVEAESLRHDFVRKSILYLIYGCHRNYLVTSEYFSCFADMAVDCDFPVVKNEYRMLKSGPGVEPGIVSEEIHILGQPLVDLGFVEKSHYLDILRGLSGGFQGSAVYYPHPGESRSSLEEVGGLPGLEIRQIDCGYELHFAGINPKPSHVIGFYSSVFPVLAKLNPGTTRVLAVDIVNAIRDEQYRADVSDYLEFLASSELVERYSP